MSLSLGQTLAGLLNATFGNAVEIIVGIVALLKGEVRIVQTSVRTRTSDISVETRVYRARRCLGPFCRIFSWFWVAPFSPVRYQFSVLHDRGRSLRAPRRWDL
jgi:hypothetical protein